MEIQEALEILEPIAKSFTEESQEYEALEMAARALAFSYTQKTNDQFMEFIAGKDRPLSGIELIHLRFCDIDIPEELRTPEVMELASEIDAIAAKLRGK